MRNRNRPPVKGHRDPSRNAEHARIVPPAARHAGPSAPAEPPPAREGGSATVTRSQRRRRKPFVL
jgi:hypothetical protein